MNSFFLRQLYMQIWFRFLTYSLFGRIKITITLQNNKMLKNKLKNLYGLWHPVTIKVVRRTVPYNFLKMFIHEYFFCRYMFLLFLAIFRRNIQLFLEVISPTMDPLFCVFYIIRFYLII
jgi:hypothetical protein